MSNLDVSWYLCMAVIWYNHLFIVLTAPKHLGEMWNPGLVQKAIEIATSHPQVFMN